MGSSGLEGIRYDLEMSAGAAVIDRIQISGEPVVCWHHGGGGNGDTGAVVAIGDLTPGRVATGLAILTDLT